MSFLAANKLETPEYVPQFIPQPLALAIIWSAILIPLFAVLACVALIFIPSFQDTVPAPAGCTLLGMRGKSTIQDEYDPKYLSGSPPANGGWKVKSIFIYPIKSCKGVEMEKVDVVETGLKYDRQFSFAQLHSPFPLSASDSKSKKADHKWKFITQREFPLMSQVKTEIWIPDPQKPSYKEDLPYVKTGGAIVVTFPWEAPGWRGNLNSLWCKITQSTPEKSFIIPFKPTDTQLKRDYSEESYTIWKETVSATNMGLHVPPELKYFLGVRNPMTLFRVSNDREVFRTAPRKKELGWQPVTGFADAFPIHLLGISSCQELSRTQTPGSPSLSVRRFRANIVVEGPQPYEEEFWKKVKLGKYVFYVACRCVRCLMPNVDPDTGKRHGSEPNKTLRATRNVDPGAPLSGCLGMNLVPAAKEGVLRVGDVVEILDEGQHLYEPL